MYGINIMCKFMKLTCISCHKHANLVCGRYFQSGFQNYVSWDLTSLEGEKRFFDDKNIANEHLVS